jgi:hypothetical protein
VGTIARFRLTLFVGHEVRGMRGAWGLRREDDRRKRSRLSPGKRAACQLSPAPAEGTRRSRTCNEWLLRRWVSQFHPEEVAGKQSARTEIGSWRLTSYKQFYVVSAPSADRIRAVESEPRQATSTCGCSCAAGAGCLLLIVILRSGFIRWPVRWPRSSYVQRLAMPSPCPDAGVQCQDGRHDGGRRPAGHSL